MTLQVRRFDSMSLGAPTRTAHGFLRVPATVAKVGILEYTWADGSKWRELVTPESLFDQECMDSACAAPVTDLHPLEAVDASNSKDHMRGFSGETAFKDGDDKLGVNLTITDAGLIKDILDNKKQEMSSGYFAVLDKTPGTWNGQKYDAKQIKRLNNHFAVVPLGRAGHDVRLKLDSELNLVPEEVLMKINIDGVGEVEMTEAQAAAYKAKTSQPALPNVDAAGLQATAKLQAELDATKARLDAAEAEKAKATSAEQKAKDEKTRQDAITAKVTLIQAASKFVKPEIAATFVSLDSAAIMSAAILASDPKFDAKDKSETYVQVRFDMLLADGAKTDAADAAQKNLGKQLLEGRDDAAKGETASRPGAARADAYTTERHQKLDAAWKQPIGARLGQEPQKRR